MISKYLSFGFVAAGALLIGTFTQQGTNFENTGVSDYYPRSSSEEISTQHDGAEVIHRMLMADIETRRYHDKSPSRNFVTCYNWLV